jgi:excisionase family DNA binding protein
MTSLLLAGNDLVIEKEAHVESQRILQSSKDVDRIQFLVDLEDGRQLALSRSTSALLVAVLHVAAKGGKVTFTTLPSEMTTAAAAALLGISRPTLMKKIRDKEIPAHKVGSHTRVKTDDLMKFKAARNAKQKKVFADLRKMSEVLE